MRINTRWWMRQFFFAGNFLGKIVVLAVTLQRRFTNNTTSFDAKMFLRDRERIRSADFRHPYTFDRLPARDSEVRICSRAQKVAIETGLLREARPFFQCSARIRQRIELGHFPPPAQRNCDRIISVTGRHECSDDELAFGRLRSSALVCDRDLHKVARTDSERIRETRT